MIRLVLIILILTVQLASADDKSDAQTRANTLGTSLSGTYSEKDNIKNKLYNPLTSDTKMQTLSQSWKCPDKSTPYETQSACNAACSTACVTYTFDGKLQCSSSTEAVIISPYTFSAGGEVTLKIQYDTDLDGSVDSNFTTSNISGFCTNGYVSCTPGTFSNCKYYEFGVKHKCGTVEYNTYRECDAACTGVCKPSDNKVLSFQRSVSEMKYTGGCFCANTSCGSSFNGVFQNALSYFGGGITAHAMKELGLALMDTDVDTSTLSVKYYAANAASCLDSSDDKTDTLKSYYQIGSMDYDDELTEQLADSESLYNTVTAQNNKTAEMSNCSITNTPMIESSDASVNVTYNQHLESSSMAVYTSGCACDTAKSDIFITSISADASGVKIVIDGSNAKHMDNRSPTLPYSGESVIIEDNCNDTYAHLVNTDGKYYVAFTGSYCNKNTQITANYGIIDKYLSCPSGYSKAGEYCVRPYIVRNNNCSILSSDTKCKLYSETVNNSYNTVLNYLATGINPVSTCEEFTGASARFVVCDYGSKFDIVSSITDVVDSSVSTISSKNDGLEWFSIKRTYVCQDGSSYDFTDARKQADMVGSTLDKDSGDFNYYSENGVSTGNVKIDSMAYDTCSYTCTVQVDDTDTTVFPDQTTREETSAVVKEQRPCGSEKICPYDSASETLISDCACTSAFNEVISLFSTLNDAVHDMICSSTSK